MPTFTLLTDNFHMFCYQHCFTSGGQFNKETTSVHVLQVGVLFLSSHKFEFNQNLYKILLQASNLYLHWYFIEFNLYELKLYVCTLQLQKSTHAFSVLKRLPDWATFATRFMVHSNKLFPQNKACITTFLLFSTC